MIESITLRNFRGHVATTVPCAPFTLLVGENASGKTSVLHALRYVSEGIGNTLPAADALRREEVVVLGRNQRGVIVAKRLDEFADERLRSMLSTGELWLSEGDDWVKR